MDLGLSDRVFIVTGGSRGLGFATAKALVDDGAKVLLTARDPGVLAAAAEALGGPNHAVGLPSDLTDPEAPERLVAATVARFGRLDGALLSVGGPNSGTALSLDDTAWREAFELIFLGPLRYARAVSSAISNESAMMLGEGGSLAFVLSTSVQSPVSGLSLSNSLRRGLAGVVKDLADELAGRGIRVNGLLPGRLATDRTFALDARNGSPDLVRRRTESGIPLGRYGEPDEFGRVAAFVLSPAASYVTGTLVTVDGGMLRSL